jgi:hypothetical protein
MSVKVTGFRANQWRATVEQQVVVVVGMCGWMGVWVDGVQNIRQRGCPGGARTSAALCFIVSGWFGHHGFATAAGRY